MCWGGAASAAVRATGSSGVSNVQGQLCQRLSLLLGACNCCVQAGPSGRIGSTPGEQVVVAPDGRVRRRAVFGEDALPAGTRGMAADSGSSDDDEEGSEEEDEEDSSSGEEDEARWQQRQQRGAAGPSSGSDEEEDEEEEEEEEEGMGAAAAWKAHMLERASALFRCAGRPLPAVARSRARGSSSQ